MNREQSKLKIKLLVAQAESLVPQTLEKNLPDIKDMPGIPDWHNYEQEIWKLGEDVRQELLNCKSLRKDKQLLDLFLRISLNRNAKRGRQSFIMLLWYKHCREYAAQLVSQVDDDFVVGHIIKALNKMQAAGFSDIVSEFADYKVTWIRNQARKYLSTHKNDYGLQHTV